MPAILNYDSHVQLAAELVRKAPSNVGDPLPSWGKLEALGNLVLNAAVAIRQLGDELDKAKAANVELVTAARDLVNAVKEPELASAGFDQPPEYLTAEDDALARCLFEVREVIAKQEVKHGQVS